MKINIHKRTTCRLCESGNVELAVPLQPVPLTEKYLSEDELGGETQLFPIDLYFCRDCSLSKLPLQHQKPWAAQNLRYYSRNLNIDTHRYALITLGTVIN